MSHSRLIIAAVLVVSAVVAAVAMAAPIHSLDAGVTPSKPGTREKPKNVELALHLSTRTDKAGDPIPATKKIETSLPRELMFGSSDFASCQVSVLESGRDCRGKSEIGGGHASFVLQGLFGATQTEADITAYNGPKGKSIVLHLKGPAVDRAIAAPLNKADAHVYGRVLVIKIPDDLRQGPGGEVALVDLRLALEKKVKRPRVIPYVGLGPCRDDDLSFKSVSTYTKGRDTATDHVRCAD